MDYTEKVQRQRDKKDFQFKNHHHSPLLPQQKLVFKKLNYFPINENLRFSVKINEFENKKHLEMQTNTGDIQHYIDFGTVSFSVDGESTQLHVYKTDRDPNYFFVPFKDKSSPKESYGAGRYLELEPDHHEPEKYILDFNFAYNPLTPPPNWLQVRIEAGEKKFK